LNLFRQILCAVLLVALPGIVLAGEIPGVPPPRLPSLEPVAELYNSNDNLGRGKHVDDFRTQQFGVALVLDDRWLFAADHSILTFDKYANENPDGRLDQVSASLGYRLFRRRGENRQTNLDIGAGFRSTDNFGGSRIQNGFHQLASDRIVESPYVDSDRTDLAGWIRGDQAGPLPWGNDQDSPWRWGYWLNGATAATSDGQTDGTGAANLTLNNGRFDAWLGLRGDWRSGYDQDQVQSATADNEEGGYINVGVRYGPILVETVQGFDDDKAFGRVSIFSGMGGDVSKRGYIDGRGVTVAITVPRTQVVAQGRIPVCRVFTCDWGSRWRLMADGRYGKPSEGTSPDVYLEIVQLGLGLELEDRPGFMPRWLAAYGSVGAGWRREEVFGELDLSNAPETSESSARVMGEAGIRAALQPADQAWRLRVQVGLSGWLPFDSKRVDFADGRQRLLKPDASLLVGGVLDFGS
jgi:hypothetical protein